MIEVFYGLSTAPFRLAPDARFFFAGETHRKALAYLDYGLRQGEGFLVLSGEVGAGKSLLVVHLLAGLDRAGLAVVALASSGLEPQDALRAFAAGLGVEGVPEGKAHLLAALQRSWREHGQAGRRVLLIVDEAQNLPAATLEELRMLTNLGAGEHPALQCFLVGQPQLRRLLARPELEQLRQRVIASCHLGPLTAVETGRYAAHRLEVAGWRGRPAMAPGMADAVHAATGGIPRRINLLYGRLLLFGAVEGRERLDEGDVAAVVADLRAEGLEPMPGGNIAGEGPVTATGDGLAARVGDLEALVRETRGMLAAVLRRKGEDGAEPG